MNGNIQVEPSRVKLDKQGATSLKEEKTVDAIVRPQLTITQSHPVSYKLLLFLYNLKSFREISGMGEWAPPSDPVPVLPPSPHSSQNAWHGGFVSDRRVIKGVSMGVHSPIRSKKG